MHFICFYLFIHLLPLRQEEDHMKEYVQSSRMDQCSLTATSEEQYVDIEIPEQLIRGWQQ